MNLDVNLGDDDLAIRTSYPHLLTVEFILSSLMHCHNLKSLALPRSRRKRPPQKSRMPGVRP
jgi:hypothetical protein